jgi:prolyl-tRNA synthetase
MKLSQNFTKTTREAPADEVAKNAQLLIRAGYVHKAMPGVYAYLPLGLRMLNKIEEIIRKGMNEVGGQEISMNNLQPKEWWVKADNRWDKVDVLFHVPSQTKAEYALNQSNEEQVTMIAKDYINSYKDMPEYPNQTPLAIYQIQTKFRDEIRSKAGLMRGREFQMKDMYDFHLTRESQDAYYETVRQKYMEIYQNMGIEAYSTRASGGAFSKFSHEFQVVTPAGEDWLVQWSDGVMDNLEIAKGKPMHTCTVTGGEKILRQNLTDDIQSTKNHADNAGVSIDKILKTVMYCNKNGEYLGICIRGDLEINEELLIQALEGTKFEGQTMEIATSLQMQELGAIRGRTTSIEEIAKKYNKLITWIFDKSIEGACDMVASLYQNVDVERDCVTPLKFDYLATIQVGFQRDDQKAVCEDIIRSAEVGNIFKLGNKWSKKGSLEIPYITKENTQDYVPFMGCYGIGVSRCMGVIAEKYSDEKGLKLPKQVAPFELHLMTHLDKDETINEQILALAKGIYEGKLKLVLDSDETYKLLDTTNTSDLLAFASENSNFSLADLGSSDVLWDDRSGKISIGEKLKDADLIGCPLQLVISKRSLENGGMELIIRETGDKFVVVV